MTTLLFVVHLIVSSAPPLPPAEAVAALRRADPDLDLSRGLYVLRPEDGLVVITRHADDRRQPGEVVPLDRVTFKREPLGRTIHGLTYRLPRRWDRPASERRHPSR